MHWQSAYGVHIFLLLLLLLQLSPEHQTWAKDEIQPGKTVSLTFDDLPVNGPSLNLSQLQKMNADLTKTIQARQIPAIGFVNEKKLYEKKGELKARTALLQLWLDRGCDLGNHTFSHLNLSTTPLLKFENDVIRGEQITAKLLAKKNKKLEYFRYPYLETGADEKTRNAIKLFLKQRNYKDAPVSIDTQDWLFSAIYTRAKLRGDQKTTKRVAEAYLSYSKQMFAYCEKASQEIVGHPIPLVLLLHCNSLNADYLDKLLNQMQDNHYDFISLPRALENPAYKDTENYEGNKGDSWLKRWGLSQRKKISIKPEPQIPTFIQNAYKDAQYSD